MGERRLALDMAEALLGVVTRAQKKT
jgi:hypothetical protein